MAIEKNNFNASRLDSEFSLSNRNSMSSDDNGFQQKIESDDDDDECEDADSGAGSDDFDLLELGETGAEFVQVGNQTCSVPLDMYDLQDLSQVLSLDVWNDCLTEEERFSLTKYLPDMDQQTFMRTLKELFSSANLHFGNPVTKLFEMLKGGLCEPRVALYRQGLNFFQKRQHYHLLRKHQNNVVCTLQQIAEAWLKCRGYSIEERLQILNIIKSQRNLMHEKMENMESGSSEREESGGGLWTRKPMDKKAGQKSSRRSVSVLSPSMKFPSRGRTATLVSANYGKQNAKDLLKMAGSKMPKVKELVGRPFGPALALNGQSNATGYASGVCLRNQMRGEVDVDDALCEMDVTKDHSVFHSRTADKSGLLKMGIKYGHLRSDELSSDGLMGLPFPLKNELNTYSRNKKVNQLSDIKVLTAKPPNKRTKHSETVQNYAGEDKMKFLRDRVPKFLSKRNAVELSDEIEQPWHKRTQDPEPMDKYDNLNVKANKGKSRRESPDLKLKSYRASLPQTKERASNSGYKARQEKMRGNSVQNGGSIIALSKGPRLLSKSEETESDSSEELDEAEESNPLMHSKSAFSGAILEGARSSFTKTGQDPNGIKYLKKYGKEIGAFNGVRSSKKRDVFFEHGCTLDAENDSSKAKQKGKTRDAGKLGNFSSRLSGDDDYSCAEKLANEANKKYSYKLGKNNLRNSPAEGRPKGGAGNGSSVHQSGYMQDYLDEYDGSLEARVLADDNGLSRLGKKGQTYSNSCHDRSDPSLLGCNLVAKRQKCNEDMTTGEGQIDRSPFLKKQEKLKVDADSGSVDMETSELPATEMEVADMELETRLKKKPFTLITPTLHTGFSFSIIHLLSAVRMAMTTSHLEDSLEEVRKHLEKNVGIQKLPNEQTRMLEGVNGAHSHGNLDISNSMNPGQGLTVQEIVNRVRLNPGDPCILETQEPLHDLVRGVLKIFSSKTAPLGAKGWKPLVIYEKSMKSWSWVGPISRSSSDHETIEEVTSPEAWGLPYKMMVKLVDSFANWLKNGQETLQQIGSLPAPPASLLQANFDEKDRFKDLRAQKSLITIPPSSEEARAYFRREEVLRYSIPDRAFSYMAADGKKSIVAPLRRCGGKPTSKARDHFMLKRDRPPHVTILCLVRDAAARLPGSIGTRADVCTLIRDSQYIVEDVSDAQVNQVVSGALDRLHYERDPCVQFDAERKLWVYLHREREEEDFEDDGTSSTKKWKRQKKDVAEPFEQCREGNREQTGLDLCSDLNAEPSGMDEGKGGTNLFQEDARQIPESHSSGAEQGLMEQAHHPMVWETLRINPAQENKLLCQENSTNEDFDDESETFGREGPGGLLSASLL